MTPSLPKKKIQTLRNVKSSLSNRNSKIVRSNQNLLSQDDYSSLKKGLNKKRNKTDKSESGSNGQNYSENCKKKLRGCKSPNSKKTLSYMYKQTHRHLKTGLFDFKI
jgi:CHAD domain-containing protein